MKKILVILGSTSTGKTDLALNLAGKFNGEIIACDSRQVYKGLDIGTGKMPSKMSNVKCQMSNGWWEIDGVKVWMYDVVDPKEQYNVARFVKQANKVIKNVNKRGKLPILVGGTGLYLKALLEGLPNLAIPVDKNLRKKLQKLSKEKLQQKLKKISPERWNTLNNSDRENPRRLIRAIELETSPRRSSFDFAQDHLRGVSSRDDILKIGLTAKREILYKRVDQRVIDRINQGMIEEAKSLQKKDLSLKRMRELGLEYQVLADYLVGNIREVDGLIKVMQNKIHGYVRRQLTWFKKKKDIAWFDIQKKDYIQRVEELVTKWYH